MSYLCADRFAALAGLSITATASRYDGVGPLPVFFSAIGTTQSGVDHPYHDLEYKWDFGANVTGNWAVDSTAKRYATGPIQACVFPVGTHTVTLAVFNGLMQKVYTFATITADDPDVVFSGASTIVVATDGVFTGKPTGATEVTSSDFDSVINTSLAPNTRILFKRDQAFETSTAAAFDTDGPWYVGAWSTGAKPTVTRTAGSVMFQIGANGSDLSDGRICDLDLQGASTSALTGVNGAGNVDNILFSGVDITATGGGFSFSATATNLNHIWSGLYFYECDVAGLLNSSGGVGLFLMSEESAILGCTVNDTTAAEHCIRSMYFNNAVIWKNTFQNPASTKACMTLRAPDWSVGSGVLPANTYSEYVYVAGNKFIGGSGVTWPVNFGPDNASDARLRNFIVEKNYLPLAAGASALVPINLFYADETGPFTIRNNVIDTSGIAFNFSGIKVGVNGTGPSPAGARVYNNTVYTNQASVTVNGVNIASGSTNTQVYNNLIWTPNAASVDAILDNGTTSSVADNSSDAQAISATPPFTDSTPTAPADFAPADYAVSGGDNAVPVFDDYLSVRRGYGNTAPVMSVGAIA